MSIEVREKLVEAAAARGASLAALSRMIGRNGTYLQQFVSRGSPRKLEEEDRRTLAQFLGLEESDLGAPPASSGARNTADGWVDVPRLDIDASAGPGANSAQEIAFDKFRFSRRWLAEQGLDAGQLSAIRVMGDSMEPTLHDGDEVLVDTATRAFRDGIHVVRLDDSLLVKRVASMGGGRFTLISENAAYPDVEVAPGQFAIIGRVVWKSGRV